MLDHQWPGMGVGRLDGGGGGGLGPGGEEESYCLSKKRVENRKPGNQALGALRRSVCGGGWVGA